MPKRARKHPKHTKPQRERVNFYVDSITMKILDSLVKTNAELDSRSAAIRYVVRWYERAAQGNDAAS
jgi:hypothetical protein